MGIYGKAAVRAAHAACGSALSPQEAWMQAIAKLTKSISSRKKNCPRSTFLGLCDEGYVVGIPKGKSTRSEANKRYAIEAVKRLKSKPALATEKKAASVLWEAVGEGRTRESQMDVVLSLWDAKLIR
jgi:hypothetical protein